MISDWGWTMVRKPSRVDAPRLVAAEVLLAVEDKGQFSNLALPRALRQEQRDNPDFTYRDSAFVSELVYGTIRAQGTLDFILADFSSQPLTQLEPAVLVCLRLGAYQILYTRVPEHAAVGETVSVARQLAGEGASRFVNAVLRALLREGKPKILARIENISDADLALQVGTSHPGWIVDATREALQARDLPSEEVQAALEANNKRAEVTLVARPGLVSATDLANEAEDILGTATTQGLLSEYAVTIASGDPGALPSVRSGEAAVQDEGSQFAAILLAEAPLEGEDSKWLDLCAGPGGKSALLAALAAPKGAQVTANEVNPGRARLVERSVQALDNVSVTVKDGRDFDPGFLFDRVLVDAPCLGLGSLRRRPESRWRHSSSDLEELVPLQAALLDQAVRLARPGGLIAWVTCSPHVEETLERVRNILSDHPVELLDAAELAQTLVPTDLDLGHGDEIASKTVQLWPHRHGTDAMFVALLRRQ